MDPNAVLVEVLADTDIDDSILEYMASILEELTDEERRSSSTIEEMISPFLIDSDAVDEETAKEICSSISRTRAVTRWIWLGV